MTRDELLQTLDTLTDADDRPLPSDLIVLARDVLLLGEAFRLGVPQRVCTDGEGGIAFERGAGAAFESVHVHPDGRVERLTFVEGRLRERQQVIP
jgi:hypothetical protein